MPKKFLRRVIQCFLFLILTALGLVWLPTGSWLVLPIVRYVGEESKPPFRLEGLEGSLYGGYTATGVEVVSGDVSLLEVRHLFVRPDWSSILSGTPWIESVELEGLSADVQNLRDLAKRFENTNPAPSAPLRIRPLHALVRDVRIASPQGDLQLDFLALSEEGALTLRANTAGVSLSGEALIGFSPLEIISSDLRIGKGRGTFRGRLEPPFDFRGDLTAVSLEPFLGLIPSSDIHGSGRIDGRFTLRGTANTPEADGVLSLTHARVRDVPVELRLPWNWSEGILVLSDAAFRSLSAEMSLTLSADLSGGVEALRLAVQGSAKNLSLKNIGRIFAPQAQWGGEGGRIRFDLTADAAGHVSGKLAASLPEVAAGGKRLVRNLTADVILTPGAVPHIACDGEVFGGRVQGRGEAVRKGKALRPEMIFSATGLDTALMAAAFPTLAGIAPTGKLALTVRIDEELTVSGTLSSPRLTAGGVTVQGLSASLRYSNGQAVLEKLDGRVGKAPLSLSGIADLRRQTLGFEGQVQGLNPQSIPQVASQVQGTCDIKAFVGGTFSAPRVTVHISGKNNRVAGVPLRGLRLSGTYTEKRLTIPETVLNLPSGALSFRGTVELPPRGAPRLNFSGSLANLNLTAFSKAMKLTSPLEGTLRGDLKVSGVLDPPKNLALSASLRGSGIKSGALSIPQLELDIRGTPKELRVDRLWASSGSGTIEGKGAIALEAKHPNNKINLKLTVKGVEVRPLLGPIVSGAPVGGILNGALTLQGSIAKPLVTLRVDSPLTIRETLVDRLALSLQSSGKDRFSLHVSGKLGDFQFAANGDIRRKGDSWHYSMTTDPMDLDRMLSAKSPAMRGKLGGKATAKLTGGTRTDRKGTMPPVTVFLSIPKLTTSGMTVTNITLPFQVSGGEAHLSGGRAMLCKGTVRVNAEVNLTESKWEGTVSVQGMDMGDATRPFLPQGELLGSADINVRLKGNFGTLMMVFANGDFSTSKGHLHKVKVIEAVSPIKRITFETIRGTFFWDGSDLWLNPGTQATAAPGDPLYRYFSVNGSLGVPGKGLKLICKGRFDVQMLDKVLGTLKNVFQYFTGGLSGGGGLFKGVVGKALGIEKRDFQDVSFVLTGSWTDLQLLHLRIDKPLKNYLPLNKLNKTEEQRADNKKFRLNLKFPTGTGASNGENKTEDQFKEQLLDNLFNLGSD